MSRRNPFGFLPGECAAAYAELKAAKHKAQREKRIRESLERLAHKQELAEAGKAAQAIYGPPRFR